MVPKVKEKRNLWNGLDPTAPSEALADQVRHTKRCGGGRRLALEEVAFDVFAEDVGFEVDGVAGGTISDVSVPVGVGDDGDFGNRGMLGGLPVRDGEAYAVNGEGTLRDDVGGEIGGDVHAEEPGVAVLLEMGHVADGVDVA